MIADVSAYYLSQSLAPAPVTAQSAIGSPQSGLRLSWTNPTADSYTGVMIRRTVATTAPATPSAGTLVGDVAAPATGFLDSVGLSNGSTYTYALFAHDGTPKFASAATVQIAIPASADESYTLPAGQSLSIAAPGVLANDSSASATTLTAAIAASTSHGTVTLAGKRRIQLHAGRRLRRERLLHPAALTWTVTAPSTSPSPVVGQWHMDETSGTTMVDSSATTGPSTTLPSDSPDGSGPDSASTA